MLHHTNQLTVFPHYHVSEVRPLLPEKYLFPGIVVIDKINNLKIASDQIPQIMFTKGFKIHTNQEITHGLLPRLHITDKKPRHSPRLSSPLPMMNCF